MTRDERTDGRVVCLRTACVVRAHTRVTIATWSGEVTEVPVMACTVSPESQEDTITRAVTTAALDVFSTHARGGDRRLLFRYQIAHRPDDDDRVC